MKKGLAVLGSTGSIGTQTLDIVRTFPDSFHVVGLAARRNLEVLGAQVREFRPKLVSCEGTDAQKATLLLDGCEDCRMEEMVCDPEVDLVVTATVGDVAIGATMAAIEAGKNIAVANKETVVMAGEIVTAAARARGVSLLPLDSEPNAIWQCLRGEGKEISKLIITASGGAFRETPLRELAKVTPAQALNHPTWKMGPKITVDSATMMNKAFEVVESHWLFDTPWENIEVVLHPESIVHSMVEFVDGSVKAQMSSPDMRMPIQYALLYPDRVPNENFRKFDPASIGALTFERWETERYPCFDLALDIAKRGGTWPAALCGADDMAVQLFLSGRIGFLDIGKVIQDALKEYESVKTPSLQEILAAAEWARKHVSRLVEG